MLCLRLIYSVLTHSDMLHLKYCEIVFGSGIVDCLFGVLRPSQHIWPCRGPGSAVGPVNYWTGGIIHLCSFIGLSSFTEGGIKIVDQSTRLKICFVYFQRKNITKS